MLERLDEPAAAGASFSFETTLAGRSYARWLKQMQAQGYQLHLVYRWVPTAGMPVARVANPVRLGGHDVPEATIRRRYAAGLENLRMIYLPRADAWQLIANTEVDQASLIAAGTKGRGKIFFRQQVYNAIFETPLKP